jgi:sigma-B regulation protein RsbU (phosphoserine phosphatase)
VRPDPSSWRDDEGAAETERVLERAASLLGRDPLTPDSLDAAHTVIEQALQAEIARQATELGELRAQLDALAGRVAEDLRLAGNVQRGLQPGAVHHPRLDLAREFIPFREVGGDYYDVVALPGDRVALAIGDVMGKGIPAALLAATLTASVRSQLQAGQSTPCDLVAHVNRLFWQVSPPGLFASFFYGVLELDSGLFEYVNAGHHYPLVLRRDDTTVQLSEGGTVLGLIEDACYGAGGRVRLQSSDVFVLYSDGIVERSSPEGDLYGVERLVEAVLRSRNDPARICLYSILGDVQGWSGGTPAEDDATLIVGRLR